LVSIRTGIARSRSGGADGVQKSQAVDARQPDTCKARIGVLELGGSLNGGSELLPCGRNKPDRKPKDGSDSIELLLVGIPRTKLETADVALVDASKLEGSRHRRLRNGRLRTS